jgi:hypothetical protein
LDEDGYLFLTGRSKELIKRGGEQVSPYEVEEVLRRHPDITKCLVFAIPDPFWGELVGVAIIGDERDAVAFRKELNQFLKGEGMQPFKIPEVIVFVKEDQISKTRSNKYIRIGLAEKLGLGADAAKQKLQDMKPVRFREAAVGVRLYWLFGLCIITLASSTMSTIVQEPKRRSGVIQGLGAFTLHCFSLLEDFS